MSYETVIVEHEEGAAIARVTINRPEALNALNARVLEELYTALEQLSELPGLGVVVLTGAGEKAFVAGADIKSMADLAPEQASAFAALGHRLGDLIAHMPQIVIAAVNGFA